MLPFIGLYSALCGCSPTLIETAFCCCPKALSLFKKADDKVIIESNKATIQQSRLIIMFLFFNHPFFSVHHINRLINFFIPFYEFSVLCLNLIRFAMFFAVLYEGLFF